MEHAAPDWYALKVFYNKVFEMEDKLVSMGLPCYIAVEKVCLKGAEHMAAARYLASLPEGARADSKYIKEGPVIYVRKPMVSSLMFVQATRDHFLQQSASYWLEQARQMDVPLVRLQHYADISEDEQAWANGYLERVTFRSGLDTLLREKYRDGRGRGFVYRSADRKSFSVIPDRQMAAFRLVTESGVSGLSFFSDDDITRYKQGDKVRVTEGPLKGAEGYIRRIKKDRRLLVSIEGVVAVATSYIPVHQLEKVEE